MIDRISCGVDLGKWDKDFLNLAIKYPECRDGDVYEEYKDNLFINVCKFYILSISYSYVLIALGDHENACIIPSLIVDYCGRFSVWWLYQWSAQYTST